jgi:hypothetical protein
MMFAMDQPGQESLAERVGGVIRRLRLAQAGRQEDLAAQARQVGLPWYRATVAMIEAGRRRLTLEEFVNLPHILKQAGWVSGITYDELLGPGPPPIVPGPAFVNGPRDVAQAWRRWAPRFKRPASPKPELVSALVVQGLSDAMMRAARLLQLDPVSTAVLAYCRYGRSFEDERDWRALVRMRFPVEPSGGVNSATIDLGYRDTTVDLVERLGAHPGFARRIQAIRGHVTRELIEELRTSITPKGKKRGGG